jgi:hypothetical protein
MYGRRERYKAAKAAIIKGFKPSYLLKPYIISDP